MVLLESFSGIGGFSKGLQAAGYSFEKVYFSYIEKHATANFKYNFPYEEHIGSVTEIGTAAIERPDIITFGSPCQNFSAVGDGTGLQGTASSLVWYAVEAVRERHGSSPYLRYDNSQLLQAAESGELSPVPEAGRDFGERAAPPNPYADGSGVRTLAGLSR